MQAFLFVFAIVAGTSNIVQAGANTTLSRGLAQPILAVLTVYTVGLLGTLLLVPIFGVSLSGLRLSNVPWWSWLGGLFGLVYVLAMMYVPGKLGAALFTALTVTAAIITSTAMDHFGALGFQQHAAGLGRIVGCLLMVAGLVCLAVY